MQLNQCNVSDRMAKDVIFTPPDSKSSEWNSKEIYIHGTDSQILNYLPKTEFQLMNVKEMLVKYKVAPLSGDGGLSVVEKPRKIAFGLLGGDDFNYFNLEEIIENHTSQKKHS